MQSLQQLQLTCCCEHRVLHNGLEWAALERQDLSCTPLALRELENMVVVVSIITLGLRRMGAADRLASRQTCKQGLCK
jgi:hypothetical protein